MKLTINDVKRFAWIAALLILMLFSLFFVTKIASDPAYHEAQIKNLDQKKVLVMELSAASAATSAAITLLPDDTGTPVADKLADLSSYFLLITCAIYLEKYLLTLSGYLTFTWFLPVGCGIVIWALLRKSSQVRILGIKLITFGLTLYLTVPISLFISGKIEDTYQTSIQQTIDSARDTANEIEDASAKDPEGISGWFSKFVEGVSGMASRLQNTMNNFIEAVAVLIVTSCVFPLLTFLCCMWVVRLIWGVDVGDNVLSEMKHHLRR
ncbi:MAG: hypothetical protein KBT01_00330 [Clostridiales bacterium]|nr:hypothetical protein [Candidatus Blautia equi]